MAPTIDFSHGWDGDVLRGLGNEHPSLFNGSLQQLPRERAQLNGVQGIEISG